MTRTARATRLSRFSLNNPGGGILGSLPQPRNDGDNDSVTDPSVDQSGFFCDSTTWDFLNRGRTRAGLNFWVNNIESCGCGRQRRAVNASTLRQAFFLSIEFQQRLLVETNLQSLTATRPTRPHLVSDLRRSASAAPCYPHSFGFMSLLRRYPTEMSYQR